MIISADKTGYSPAERNVIEGVQSDVPIVLVTRREGFVFNEELLSFDKWVLCNMSEMGWNFSWDYTPMFGVEWHFSNELFPGEEWKKFNKWVCDNPPVLTFQREIRKQDLTDKIKPLSYHCYVPQYEVQTREQFNARPIELANYWGRSSEERMWFQGNAYLHATKAGIDIVDNLYYLNGMLAENKKRIWVTAQIPHYARIPIAEILKVVGMSKLGLSQPGCGKHCFRDAEIPAVSVMVLQDNDIAFPFEWVHGENCIRYKGDNPIPAIEEALKRGDLYDIYVNGVKHLNKYRNPQYSKYIEDEIKKAL